MNQQWQRKSQTQHSLQIYSQNERERYQDEKKPSSSSIEYISINESLLQSSRDQEYEQFDGVLEMLPIESDSNTINQQRFCLTPLKPRESNQKAPSQATVQRQPVQFSQDSLLEIKDQLFSDESNNKVITHQTKKKEGQEGTPLITEREAQGDGHIEQVQMICSQSLQDRLKANFQKQTNQFLFKRQSSRKGKSKDSAEFQNDAEDILDQQFQQCLMFYEHQEEKKLVKEEPQKPDINLTTNANALFRQSTTKELKEPPSQVASKKRKGGASKREKHQYLLQKEPQKLRITLTVNNLSTWPLQRDCQDAEMIDLDKIRDKFQDVQSELFIEEETPVPNHMRAPQAQSQQVSGLGLGLQYKKMFAKATGTTTPRNDTLGSLHNNTDFDYMKELLSGYGVSVKKLSKENIKRLHREMVTYLNTGQLPDYLLNEQVLI